MGKKVTTYGSGQIGNSWAALFLKGGYDVFVYDIAEERLDLSRKTIKEMLVTFEGVGMIPAGSVEEIYSHATFTLDKELALKDTTFVQESGPENLETKRAMLAEIEQYAPADTIIASSSSGIVATLIAENAVHPERVMIGHPYNPVYLMPLVEIAKGVKTSDEKAKEAKVIYESIGKEVCTLNKEAPGFVCNRLQIALVREAYDIVRRGIASVEDVDKAVEFSIGLRWALMGPHLVYECGGGPGGWEGLMRHIFPSTRVWLEDMAKWDVMPDVEDYIQKGVVAIKEEMAHREPGRGQNHDELTQYLGKGLIAILKFKGKI